MHDELAPKFETKRDKYPRLLNKLYNEVFITPVVTLPLCFFVDSKKNPQVDPQSAAEFNHLCAFLCTLSPMLCTEVQEQDPIFQKVEKEKRTRVVSSKQVQCGTKQDGTKIEWWSSNSVKHVVFDGGKKPVEVPNMVPVFKTENTLVDEEREMKTLYNGTVVYGDWVELNRYTQDA